MAPIGRFDFDTIAALVQPQFVSNDTVVSGRINNDGNNRTPISLVRPSTSIRWITPCSHIRDLEYQPLTTNERTAVIICDLYC